MPEKNLKITINSRFEEVESVTDAVRQLCMTHLLLGEEESYTIVLCVVEAVNNAIEHGYAGLPGKIEIECYPQNGYLQVKIMDRGKPMEPNRLAKASDAVFDIQGTSIENIPERGRGLALIKKIMDEAAYETKEGKNTITMIKKLKTRK